MIVIYTTHLYVTKHFIIIIIIIIIIMDGPYVAQIFPWRKFSVLRYTIHTSIHTYNLHTWKTWSMWICGKVCWKRKVLNSDRMGRFHKLAGSTFQTAGATKPKECSQPDSRLCFRIFKSFSSEEQKVHDVQYVCAKQSWKLRRECTTEVPYL